MTGYGLSATVAYTVNLADTKGGYQQQICSYQCKPQAGGVGDPHFTGFEGSRFDFNGKLQARLQPGGFQLVYIRKSQADDEARLSSCSLVIAKLGSKVPQYAALQNLLELVAGLESPRGLC